jgi:MFS transporter, ACS family, hexuronate transporter
MASPPAADSAPEENALPWRWIIIGLLFLGTVINYFDRLAVPTIAPVLKEQFHLSNTDYAWIANAFLFVYASTMFVWGAVFDRLGNRFAFALAVIIWSVAEIGTAAARGMASFCGLRGLLGLGESGNWPGATRTIAAWFPPRQRALGMGIANTGASLGPAIATPLILWIYELHGWRAVFITTGALGFVWLALWLALYPRAKAAVPGAVGAAAPHVRHPPVPWAVLVRRREVWGIVLARFFGDPIWWLYLNWLPLYLYNARHFDLKSIAAFGWMPYCAAALGAFTGGWASGFLMRLGWDVSRARKTAIIIGTVCMLGGAVAAYTTSAYAALAWLCVTLFGFQFWVGNVQTLPSDFFPVGAVGSIAGFAGSAAGFGSVIFTFSTGAIVDHFSYTPVLLIAAALAPLATITLFLLCGRVRRLEDVRVAEA